VAEKLDLPAKAFELKDLRGNPVSLADYKGRIVLVDFWAEWCTPCRMVSPIIESLATHYGDKLTMGKLNVDKGRKVATQYGVRSIPTLLLFKDGKPMRQFVGFMSEKELKKNLDTALVG